MGRKLVFLAFIISTFLSGAVFADMCIVQKIHVDPYSIAGMSIPAKDDQSQIWFAGDKMSMNNGKDTSMIMRIDKNSLYIIFNKEKAYSEFPLDLLQKSADAVSNSAPEMASMMKFTAKVNETEESKTIGKWNSKKYIVNTTIPMGSAVTEMWSSTDIKVDYAMLAKLKNSLMASMPGFPEMMKEYAKIKGFPVLSETTTQVMGMEIKSKEELINISEKTAPDGTYDIPGGYKKKDLNK